MAEIVEDPSGGMYELRPGPSRATFPSLRDQLARAASTSAVLESPANRDAMARALVDANMCSSGEATSLSMYEIRELMESALTSGRLSLWPRVRTLRPMCEVVTPAEPVESLMTEDETEVEATHSFEFSLVDDEGQPVANEPYRVELPSGETIEGNLDARGRALLTGIEGSGNCVVTFPRWDADAWAPA